MNMKSIAPKIHLQWFGEGDPPAPAAPAAPAAPPAAPPAAGTPPVVSWRDTLPENLKTSPSLSKFDGDKPVEKLAKSYVELESMLGKNIIPPGKDAKPEDWDRFYSKLGRPKVAEDYELSPVEGFEPNPAFVTRFRQKAFAAGTTPAQAASMFEFFTGETASAIRTEREKSAQEIAAAETELRQAWGPEYDNNVTLASEYTEKVGGKGALEHLEKIGVANDPVILKLLARAGQATNGRPLVKGNLTSTPGGAYDYMNRGEKRPN